jgi:hypothetical protein
MSLPVPAPLRTAPRAVQDIRCACRECGAHLIGWRGYTLSGRCGNCGSYDVQPVVERTPLFAAAA